MNVNVKYLKDENGEVVSPVTSTTSVFDSNGKKLSEVLNDTLPIGTIIPWGSETIPNGWLKCDGEVYSIQDYQELYAVIGLNWVNSSVYGASEGYFCVPDLAGRSPIGVVDGLNSDLYGETYNFGDFGGEETHILTVDEIPAHKHHIYVKNNSATGLYEAKATNSTGTIGDAMTESTGGDQSHNNMSPYLVVYYIIKAKHQAQPDMDNILYESLPVGTELEYNGTTVPDGWEVVDDPYTYSTEERKVGTWIDGKPIYSKTIFVGALVDNSTVTVNHGVEDLERYIKAYGNTRDTNGNFKIIPEANSDGTISILVTGSYIRVGTTNSNRARFNQTYVTIEYTKTTD